MIGSTNFGVLNFASNFKRGNWQSQVARGKVDLFKFSYNQIRAKVNIIMSVQINLGNMNF